MAVYFTESLHASSLLPDSSFQSTHNLCLSGVFLQGGVLLSLSDLFTLSGWSCSLLSLGP